MIKDNQRYFNRLHVVFDALVIAMSYVTAWFIKFQGPFSETSVRVLSFEQYMSALVFIVPGFLILYYAFNLYTPKRMQGRRLELANITKASTLGVFLIMVALYVLRIIDFSRSVIFIFYGINIVAETLLRNVIRYILRDMRRRGFNQKHVLLVGYSRAAEEYVDRIITNPQWGYTVYGILDDDVEAGTVYKGISVIGRISDLIEILERESLDEIAITLGLGEYYRLEEIVALCEKSGVHTKFIPDYNNIIPTKPYTEDILGLPVINIRHVPLTNNFYALVKRIIDILGSLCGMALASPVMLAACLLIKITSPGPLIYRQERVGLPLSLIHI